MEIVLNKDFTKYKKETWKGLSKKELLFGLFLSMDAIGCMFFCVFLCKVPLTLAVLMVLPLGVLATLVVFYRPDQMSFLKYLQNNGRHLLLYRAMYDEDRNYGRKEEAGKKHGKKQE